METTGKSIQLRRLRIGMKSKDVAAALGISPSYYSEIERGKKPVPSNSEFISGLDKLFASAERENGLAAPLDLALVRTKNDNETAEILRTSSASLSERLRAYPVGSYMWAMELESAIFEADLNVSSIADTALKMARLSTVAGLKEGQSTNHAELRALGKKAHWQAQKVLRMCQEFFPAISDAVDATQRTIDRAARDQTLE